MSNDRDQKPIGDAKITLGTGPDQVVLTSMTSGKFDGSVRLSGSRVTVTVEKTGFHPWSDIVDLDESPELDIPLAPKYVIAFAEIGGGQGTSGNARLPPDIAATIKQSFVDCNDFDIITNDALREILGRERFEDLFQKGVFDPRRLTERDKKIGATHLVTGYIASKVKQQDIHVSMYDMEEGTIVDTMSMPLDNSNPEETARDVAEQMVGELARAAITKIRSDPQNDRMIELNGTVSCLPSKWAVWISVRPFGTEKEYPQARVSVSQRDWVATSVYLGDEDKSEDRNRRYLLSLILTDAKANEKLGEYILGGSYAGFAKLPEGSRILLLREVSRGMVKDELSNKASTK